MSILKMKLINIVGPRAEFDNFVMKNIMGHQIHLENAISILNNIKGLYPYIDENPYQDLMKRLDSIKEHINVPIDSKTVNDENESMDGIQEYIGYFEERQKEYLEERKEIEKTIHLDQQVIKQLKPIEDVDVDLDRLFHLEFIKFRFGKLPQESYKKLQTYLEDIEAFFVPVLSEPDYIWGIYFTPEVFEEKIDSIFSSLYFERVRISGRVSGSPSQAISQMNKEIQKLNGQIAEIDKSYNEFVKKEKDRFTNVYNKVRHLYHAFEMRKYAAHTEESFYIVGWIPQIYLKEFTAKLDAQENITYIVEEPEIVKRSKPPTELRNLRIFKPFESLVKMYGLPSYNEIDPTMLVALTFVLMFGIMFGDVGQGALLALIGWILYRKKGSDLGNIMVLAGFSSMFFGWFFGSIFGFEDVIRPLWDHPMRNSDTITVCLIAAIGIGIILVTLAMIMNIVNGIKEKKLARILFDQNGLAGFVFYWSVIGSALYFFLKGRLVLSTVFVAVCFVLPLLCMFLKEPLENLLKKKKQWFPEQKGMFFMETFFEMFEVILSFITNTISFVRVGAFALNHAGMMMVVFIFAEMARGAGSVIVIILGNILVMGLEGLIVGIQVLRLEFYELFSRFFSGTGRPFTPVCVESVKIK